MSRFEGPAVPLNRWSSISVSRLGLQVTMSVDEEDVVEANLAGVSTALTAPDAMFVGGAQQQMMTDAGFSQGFTGCIHQVQVRFTKLSSPHKHFDRSVMLL